MASIDDDLRDDRIIQVEREESKSETCENHPVVTNIKKDRELNINIIFKVINYCVDGAMLFLSFWMVDMYEEAYPLVFSFGLILWMGYRLLSFKRNKIIDIIMGVFLFAMTTTFYILALVNDYDEIAGIMMIPTVYLGYFCAWGAIWLKIGRDDSNVK